VADSLSVGVHFCIIPPCKPYSTIQKTQLLKKNL